MTPQQVLVHASWLWLPLLLVVCFALGFYRSYVDPGHAASAATSCPQARHLDRFLGCP